MSNVNRHFLGWDQPFIPTAAKWLQEHYLGGELGSAKGLVIVVSGNAVANRLQSLLVESAHAHDRAIDLPEIMTTSRLLNRLLGDRNRTTSKLLLQLITATAMRNLPRQTVTPIVGMNYPEHEDLKTWVSFATEVNKVAEEITFGGHSVDPSNWPEEAQVLLTTNSRKRLESIDAVRRRVIEILSSEKYSIQDSQWLNLLHHVPSPPERIVLLGTTNLHTLVCKVLETMQSSGVKIEVAIRAPKEKADLFDSIGCVVSSKWNSELIDIPDSSIDVAGSPSSQATSLIRAIDKLHGTYSKEEITVAVTDEDSIANIRRQLDGHFVKTRFAGGCSVLESSEVKLLAAIGEFVKTKSFHSYAALVRHPYLTEVLGITSKTLHELDRYYAHHLPQSIEKTWFTPTGLSWRVNNEPLLELHNKVTTCLSSVIDRAKHDVTWWSNEIRTLFLHLYGEQELDRQSRRLVSLQAIFTALDTLDALPSCAIEALGGVTSSDVIELILGELQGVSIPEYPNEESIDVVGWLEAMFEDAPCLFVVGMDSSLLSASTASQSYLPDQLRDALGLETTERKLARDAHAVSAMQHSRKKNGQLSWVVARTTSDGDPLTPNPLLLRCEDEQQLALRAKKMIVEVGVESPHVPPRLAKCKLEDKSGFVDLPDPTLIQTEPITKMNVTSFKEYMACSYRFWLRRVLGIGDERDDEQELDYALFGSLVHSVLEQFGKDESIRNSCDESELVNFLSNAIDKEIVHLFGKYPLSTIEVQAEMAKQRMHAFSKLQASHYKDGWRIVHIEAKVKLDFSTKDSPFIVVGKIDRIDQHEDGRVLVLDYKTGSTTAEKVHGTKDEWRDLQLPIYRHLAETLGYPKETVQTGYLLIGSKDTSVRLDLPKWDEAQLQVADDRFEEIVELVRTGKYDSAPIKPAPRFFEDLSWICQDSGIIGSGEGQTDG